MWDSAKKPIKVRSVLQSNGMRHFIVNEETDEIYSNILLQQQQQKRKNSNKVHQPVTKNSNADHLRQQNQGTSDKDDTTNKILTNNNSNSLLTRSFSHEHDDLLLSTSENTDDFFGVAGSRISNSKKHKSFHNKYFSKFPHQLKESNLIELHKHSSTNKCPHLEVDMLDLIPVKSPVIKKLINGRANPYSGLHKSKSDNVASSTTLCSRIMTWIDLEVKRNSIKGKSSSLPYSTADLNLVSEINTFEHSSSPSSSSSGSTTPSGENTSSSSGNDSSSSVSLPKLIPCWRKSVGIGEGKKAKKSVRISDDLPRWGKMKRSMRKQDRSFSLNELYNDDEMTAASMFMASNGRNEFEGNVNEKVIGRKQYNSVINLRDDGHPAKRGGSPSPISVEKEKSEKTGLIICDQALPTNGKVQVHIFLPHTDNKSIIGGKTEGSKACDTESNLSGRSEESTS